MTPDQSNVPHDDERPSRQGPDSSLSWGNRKSEKESSSRADAGSRARGEDPLVHCPACGSAKTTVVQAADRGRGNAIRRDNRGYKCFACGHGWTMTIDGDHDPGARRP